MSPKTGRPRKDNAITQRLAICLDSSMLDELNAYCAEKNISRGEAVRRALRLLFKAEK